ncbi:MAG: hypothetical protein HY834_19495 [Devosia nanyangense]|uniref:Uncharacterized protein n=1 Tax=Devosia nanyangense TaxID=1228055 RepID=A0A933L498_9HYPH|nr:hypothetical protein [Devosia nanyangense]
MYFWESCEIYRPASKAFVPIARYFFRVVNDVLSTSNLASLECEFRYIPIVMPEGMRERYPARSRLRKKTRVYDCAPQLNYDLFVGGTFEAQVREYAMGIAREIPKIKGLGASDGQIAEFEAIIVAVVDRALVERPDVARN